MTGVDPFSPISRRPLREPAARPLSPPGHGGRRGRLRAATLALLALPLAAADAGPDRVELAVVADAGRTTISLRPPRGETLGAWRHYRIADGPPRHVVVVSGIAHPPTGNQVEVDDARVRRVRIGHHPDADPPELHVVLDLADASVEIETAVQGHDLVISVSSAPAGQVRIVGVEPWRLDELAGVRIRVSGVIDPVALSVTELETGPGRLIITVEGAALDRRATAIRTFSAGPVRSVRPVASDRAVHLILTLRNNARYRPPLGLGDGVLEATFMTAPPTPVAPVDPG